ncbi:hypothetical protein FDP41_008719 [Naegleria fowleri]|uniref:Dipeptidyl peptidase 3 n=1 Tax=Naegleria fowleri TaxID=5763 RepID=A0A6A5BGC8_NAEFO|nr:uncharacterized protein FDP41_008719 [Naegleria fowleri]KAF0973055.1 hypothetical protein FDP41_008719 [Naegleria fowleri]
MSLMTRLAETAAFGIQSKKKSFLWPLDSLGIVSSSFLKRKPIGGSDHHHHCYYKKNPSLLFTSNSSSLFHIPYYQQQQRFFSHHSIINMVQLNVQSILQDEKLKHYVCPEKIPVTRLELEEAWNALSDDQKLYAHYFSRAAIAGTPIVLHQVSEESPQIYQLLCLLFKGGAEANGLKEKALKAGVSEHDYEAVINYAVSFFGNMGNYLSFGDCKFIPRCEPEEFEKVVKASGNQQAIDLFEKIRNAMYSLESNVLELGFGNSTYYSRDVTEQEAELVKTFMEQQQIHIEHTRLFKTGDKKFELKTASATVKELTTHTFQDLTITITYGDFSKQLANIRDNLGKALPFAANEHQKEMLRKYIQFFDSGNGQDFLDSQISWVKDKGPIIETNIGFIESYRDPLRVRAEFEGFVAVVNKVASQKAQTIVDNAEKFIARLPWNEDTTNGDRKPFEAAKFTKPDFTSLEVITFTSSGLPAGINIPNSFNIRDQHGFKNVSLGNVLGAPVASGEEITFLSEEDKKLYTEYKGKAFEVQVILHELLGHGSGSLLKESDIANVINPITKQPVTTFYKPGENFNSVIGEISNAYEECRAECVGIYLCLDREILKICGFEGEEADKIIYVNWLNMVRAGLMGLQFYNPDTGAWLQAHMRARYSILRVLLEAGNGLIEIKQLDNDLQLSLDKTKIETVGKKAIYDYLLKINVYKSIGDKNAAMELFQKYTSVPEEFVKMRKIVLDKKQPRKVFIQPHTTLSEDGKTVQLVNYPISSSSMIDAFVAQSKFVVQ